MKTSYDLVLMGDFRLFGGTTTSAADEIRTLAGHGYRIGLVQVDSHITAAKRGPLPEVQSLADQGLATFLAPGSRASAKLLTVHNARILEQPPAADLPEIASEQRRIVIHRAPLDGHGKAIFNAHAVHAIAEHSFGSGFEWMPISPVCRQNMAAAGLDLPLSAADWPNIVFVEDWAVERRPLAGEKPVIGRHSRAELEKYPDSAAEVLQVYPADAGLDIHMLGVDQRLVGLMGGALPANWRTWGFNAIAPRDLLGRVDFYVYYHHSKWFETFGRNVAEALASGAVTVLPSYLRATFGDAALYREPGEAIELVRRLHRDPAAWREQARRGRALIDAAYGPKRFIGMVTDLIGEPEQPRGQVAGVTLGTAPETAATVVPTPELATMDPSFVQADIAVVADMRATDETAWRIANEIRIQADARFKTVLFHLEATPAAAATVNPLIDACVREGLATPCDPEATLARVRLVVVHRPDALLGQLPERMPRILAENVVVVADRSPFDGPDRFDHLQRHRLIERLFGGKVVWAAVEEELRRAFEKDGRVPVAPFCWTPAVHPAGCGAKDAIRRPVPTVGRIVAAEPNQWPADTKAATLPFPPAGRAVTKLLLTPKARLPFDVKPLGWHVAESDALSPLKFLTQLDMLPYYPGAAAEHPAHAVAWAMQRGVLPLMPASLRPVFGDGPLYVEPGKAAAAILALWADQPTLEAKRAAAAEQARRRFGPAVHLGRLQKLLGPVVPTGAKPAAPWSAGRRRVLFLTSNGTGLGHVTRLLAVARRLSEPAVEPVFVSLSQAIEPIVRAGYAVEYVPSPIYADVNGIHWNQWLAARLEQIVAQYRPEALVFDGSATYEGVNQALGPDSRVRLIWIRRGMWRAEQDNAALIERQKYYDLVIEPADIADARDRGATARYRHLAVQVDPIRLFDEDELLPRAEACRRLGLDPSRPACLIQLGSGANRDIVTMVEDALRACSAFPELQPVVAEWLISSRQIDFWPGVKRLRGYPMSRYFRAFDFTISAAGYNSFNEIISFGLPAIFVANQHPSMDDQDGRSRFAQDMGAAFHVDEADTSQLGEFVAALMNERVRTSLQLGMRRIARANGALAAAELVRDCLG
jgi:UDP:flavonoid glycosyltransferase YjiC (YdhE family)